MEHCQDCFMLINKCICSKKKPKHRKFDKYKVKGVKFKIKERDLTIIPPHLEEEETLGKLKKVD